MTEETPVLHFGAVAIKQGFATLEQVDECLRLQDKMKVMGVAPKKLGEIMLAKNYLTEAQVRDIFRQQGLSGGHTSIAGYKVLTKIGQGAMGSIYKALQLSMDRVVAIKCLSPRYASNDKLRGRFLREARAVARLSHPNIIQGIDVGESNGIHYFAMEYIEGPTVGELIRRTGIIEEAKAAAIGAEVAHGLQHALGHGYIHCDIKPDNIMISKDGHAKLCDLGLVRMLGSDNLPGSHTNTLQGTPYYISPEQARGEPDLDTRSDIYSLGATLYHMCTGSVPFPGQGIADVVAKHLAEPLTPPRRRNPMLSERMDWVIVKMMQKRREVRHPTPKDAARDLDAIAKGHPVMVATLAPAGKGAGKVMTPGRKANFVKRARRFRRFR